MISFEEENDSKGDIEQLKLNKELREGAIEIIEQRGFSLLDKKDVGFQKNYLMDLTV